MDFDVEYGTREIEGILAQELDNWIRFGRMRDWMPASFRCPLGFMYKGMIGDVHSGARIVLRCDEEEALAFERVVCGLPDRYRAAFVMHHLDRCHIQGYIFIIKGRTQKAQILGVRMRQYHNIVKAAHQAVLEEWCRLGRLKIEDVE